MHAYRTLFGAWRTSNPYSLWVILVLFALMNTQIACKGKGKSNVKAATNAGSTDNFRSAVGSVSAITASEDSQGGQSFEIPFAKTFFDPLVGQTSARSCNDIIGVTSSNEEMVLSASIIIVNSENGCLVSFTPNQNSSGDLLFTIFLKDNPNEWINVPVKIVAVNDTPILAAISSMRTPKNTPTSPLAITISDVDGPIGECSAAFLSYTADNSQIVAASNAITWSGTWPNCSAVINPVTDAIGATLVTIIATDGSLRTSQSFNLEVGGWFQEAALAASNPETQDNFGISLGISDELVIVGAHLEDSAQTTITNATDASLDNSLAESGASYIFSRSSGKWKQQSYLKASNAGADDFFGRQVSISGDTAVVGTFKEDSGETTITNGSSAAVDNLSQESGAAYIYRRAGENWQQEAFLKASNAHATDYFGRSLKISGDTVVVGANGEASNQSTITNGASASAVSDKVNFAFAGAAYIFERTGTGWAQQAYLKASNVDKSDNFGVAVSLSGNTVLVGANKEKSNQITITNGTDSSTDNSLVEAGASYIYSRTGTQWSQEAYLKASNSDSSDLFGGQVDISGDTAVVGAENEQSNQTIITNGTTASSDNSAASAGAVYVFKRTGSIWAQEAYLKASNSQSQDLFGRSVAVSGDTVVVGAEEEDSSQSTVTNGTDSSSDNSLLSAGAVYIYHRSGSSWSQEAFVKSPNPYSSDLFGKSVEISGNTVIVAAKNLFLSPSIITNGSASGALISLAGSVYVFKSQDRNFDPDIRLSDKSTSSITLSWGQNIGKSNQLIIMPASTSTTPDPCSAATGTVVGSEITTYTFSGLSPATNYTFRICGFDGTNHSDGAVLRADTE